MKQWVRFPDLGKHLGVSRATINRWIKRGMPHHKVGRVVLFDPAEVEAWIRSPATASTTAAAKKGRGRR